MVTIMAAHEREGFYQDRQFIGLAHCFVWHLSPPTFYGERGI